MCYKTKNVLNKNQVKKQGIAITFLVGIIVVALIFGAFILTHADHTHDHNGVGGTCATCVQIQNIENLFKLIGTTIINGFATVAWLHITIAIIISINSNLTVLTPITAKTRMNN